MLTGHLRILSGELSIHIVCPQNVIGWSCGWTIRVLLLPTVAARCSPDTQSSRAVQFPASYNPSGVEIYVTNSIFDTAMPFVIVYQFKRIVVNKFQEPLGFCFSTVGFSVKNQQALSSLLGSTTVTKPCN